MHSSLLLINYHYVRDPSLYCYPGIHPLMPSAFARQMQLLKDRFHLTSPEEAEDYLTGKAGLPGPSALVTFDDGLVDHAVTAREMLDPMGIKAVFFVCSRPLTELRALAVHKVHWLRATTNPDLFRQKLYEALPDKVRGMTLNDEQRQSALRTYIYDTPENAEVKYLLNFVLPEETVDALTSQMLSDRGIDEADFCRETYMDQEALSALEQSGHRVGAHSHDHRPVTRLGNDEDRDIRINIETIRKATGRHPDWFSYPYGRDWALPSDPEAFCRRHGFSFGVTLTGTWVRPAHAPYAIDRINTNDVETVLSNLASS
jgi:peptidoglycan/xylan/chitin deacetylase (PgdA/CDA1 family)